MYGRFSVVTDNEKIKKAVKKVKIDTDLPPRFNIAPTQAAFVINNDVDNSLEKMFWAKITVSGSPY